MTTNPPADHLVKRSVGFTEDQLDRLRRESALSGAPVAFLVRKAVNLLFPPESEAGR